MQIYVVKPGDSLYSIAKMFGISLHMIMETNGLERPNDLVVGDSGNHTHHQTGRNNRIYSCAAQQIGQPDIQKQPISQRQTEPYCRRRIGNIIHRQTNNPNFG